MSIGLIGLGGDSVIIIGTVAGLMLTAAGAALYKVNKKIEIVKQPLLAEIKESKVVETKKNNENLVIAEADSKGKEQEKIKQPEEEKIKKTVDDKKIHLAKIEMPEFTGIFSHGDIKEKTQESTLSLSKKKAINEENVRRAAEQEASIEALEVQTGVYLNNHDSEERKFARTYINYRSFFENATSELRKNFTKTSGDNFSLKSMPTKKMC